MKEKYEMQKLSKPEISPGDNLFTDCLAMAQNPYFLNENIFFDHRKTEEKPAEATEGKEDGFHSHRYYELQFCKSGAITFFCNGNAVDLQEGTVVLFAPNSVHSHKPTSVSVYDRYLLCFSPDAFSFLPNPHPLVSFAEHSACFFAKLPPAVREEIFSLLAQTERILEERSAASHTLALSELLRILVIADRHRLPAEIKSDPSLNMIHEIRDYIDKNFQTVCSVEEIALHFSYTRSHISKMFSKYYHTQIYHYLMEQKVANSILMLENGADINTACLESGFHNMTSFIRYFKQITGFPPSKFRKEK